MQEWSDEGQERRRAARGSGLMATSMRVPGEELGTGGKRVADELRALESGDRQTPDWAVDPARRKTPWGPTIGWSDFGGLVQGLQLSLAEKETAGDPRR